jgi:hypothetical protein
VLYGFGGDAGNDVAVGNFINHTCSRGYDDVIPEPGMILDGAIQTGPAAISNDCTAADYGSGCQLAIAANMNVVRDVHHGVNLCAA